MILHPRSHFNKKVSIPASKSFVQRCIAYAIFHPKEVHIKNVSYCNDILDCIAVAKAFNKNIVLYKNAIKMNGEAKFPNEIMCGESGLTARIFSAFAVASKQNISFRGRNTLLNRSFEDVIQSFARNGCRINENQGNLPFILKGLPTNECFYVDCSHTSQFLTGLLTILPEIRFLKKIIAENLTSKPYIDLTMEVAKKFGIFYQNDNYASFAIQKITEKRKRECTIEAEGDWSNATFFLIAGAVGGAVELRNMNLDSSQGDKAILEILQKVGAEVIFLGKKSLLVRKKELKAFHYDATNTPDLFPPLAMLAMYCDGTSKIEGLHRLENKESNRKISIYNMILSLGGHCKVENDAFLISGKIPQGGCVNTAGDHRIAMAASLAVLGAKSRVEIVNENVIDKSYPTYFKDFAVEKK